VALADIIKRIESDADQEAAAIVADARSQADELGAGARSRADDLRERILEQAETRAVRERETALANARLQARDRTLEAKLELALRVLKRAEERLAGLADDDYARVLAARIVDAARGEETVSVAAADRERLSGRLERAVSAALAEAGNGNSVTFADETADLERGALLVGERMSVEVSPRAIVDAMREDILALVASVLFGEDRETEEA